tara:strand:- start:32045 stop:32653 length:609 start_codon:yes stop_codon:yes gene_type:complete
VKKKSDFKHKLEGNKMKRIKLDYLAVSAMAAITFLFSAVVGASETAAQIDRDVDNAISKLHTSSATAIDLSREAKGVLIFPDVVKAGLIIGGQYGKGALRVGGKTTGYYSTSAVSYGLQAGAQSFGYAMYFMTDKALEYLKNSDGWEVGFGPNIVVMDKGKAGSLTTTTTEDNIYVFFFDQTGLMAGLGVQGSKIAKINPDE